MNVEYLLVLLQVLCGVGGVAIIASGVTMLGALLIIISFLFSTKN